jgi:UDP-3-O-[3-hydroxymyristoyl] glucosamine N-acyltransferase
MIVLERILELLKPERVIGSKDRIIDTIRPFDEYLFFNDNTLTWLSPKNSGSIDLVRKGIIICSEQVTKNYLHNDCTYLIVREPRQCFSEVLKHFFIEKEDEPSISIHAQISNDCSIGQNVSVGHHTVIEKGCSIGNNVKIGANTVICKNTIIGDNVLIGSNCSIGGIGFGFEKNENHLYKRIPHIGNVHIDKDVEIGNNVCIDRAVLGSTYIGINSKIDNLVHIAHGVKIGKNSLIIANAMIAGSTTIGDNVWIAPSASVMNKKSIRNNALIGIGAVVIRDVESNSVVVGNPAKPIQKKN